MGPKNSYKCDLTNSLVPLIMLSPNHQKHKQWPKCCHVRYTLDAPCDTLPTAPAEHLDLDLEELSSGTDDEVSIANLPFSTYVYVFFSILLTNSSIFMQFSIGINPRNPTAI